MRCDVGTSERGSRFSHEAEPSATARELAGGGVGLAMLQGLGDRSLARGLRKQCGEQLERGGRHTDDAVDAITRKAEDQYHEQWWGPVRCCVRAGWVLSILGLRIAREFGLYRKEAKSR